MAGEDEEEAVVEDARRSTGSSRKQSRIEEESMPETEEEGRDDVTKGDGGTEDTSSDEDRHRGSAASKKKKKRRKKSKESSATEERSVPEQAEFMAAIRSMAMPKLQPYNGRDDPEGEKLDQFVKEFERHAQVAGWTGQLKVQQFALRLTGRALTAYESISEADKETYSNMREAFQAKAAPLLLKSYQSRMFHSRVQEKETVQQYAQQLQHLYDKAYGRHPMTQELKDQMLLGAFEQGLQETWKRELKPPPRTFVDALLLAQTAEAAEKQLMRRNVKEQTEKERPRSEEQRMGERKVRCYACKNEGHIAPDCPDQREAEKSKDSRRSGANVECFICHRWGHYSFDCPNQAKGSKEGRNSGGSSGGKGSAGRGQQVAKITEGASEPKEQPAVETVDDRITRMEQELTELKAMKSQRTYKEGSGKVGILKDNDEEDSLAFAKMRLAGSEVEAMLDSGSKINIIAEEKFKEIGRKAGLPASLIKPVQALPEDFGEHKLPVSAVVKLTVEFDGKEMEAEFYLLPKSNPELLIGSRLVRGLGLAKWHEKVNFRRESKTDTNGSVKAVVRFLTRCRLPPQHAGVFEAELSGEIPEGRSVMMSSREPQLKCGPKMEDAIIEPCATGRVKVLLRNEGCLRIGLKKGDEFEVDLTDVEELPFGEPATNTEQAAVTSPETKTTESPTIGDETNRRQRLQEMIDFSNSSLSEESKKRVREYVLDQGDLFALDDTELGCTHLVTHEIETGDSPPIKQHARREPYSQTAKITLLIKEMLDRGVIVPSSSPWASPIVLVRKPDGSPRFCVDYRRLNFVTEKDVFPLPRIADLLDRLGEAGVYSTLDLAFVYWQIAMGKKSQPKTAFATGDFSKSNAACRRRIGRFL